jgi:hypothetical protein
MAETASSEPRPERRCAAGITRGDHLHRHESRHERADALLLGLAPRKPVQLKLAVVIGEIGEEE